MISSGVLRFAQDPELVNVGNTVKSTFQLVYNIKRYDNEGNVIKEPNYLDFECWDSAAKFIYDNCRKGDQIYVEANAKKENWEKDGQKRSRVIFRINSFKVFHV